MLGRLPRARPADRGGASSSSSLSSRAAHQQYHQRQLGGSPLRARRAPRPIDAARGSTSSSPTAIAPEAAAAAKARKPASPPVAAPSPPAVVAAPMATAPAPANDNDPQQPPPPPPLLLPPVPYPQVVLLQTFGWNSHHKGADGASFWRRLADAAPSIAALGTTHAWLPPPSASVAPEGYLPGQLYDCNSAYGTADELRACCAALRAAGVRPVADVVINHRCADKQDERGRWNQYADTSADDLQAADAAATGGRRSSQQRRRIDWGRWAIAGDDPVFGGGGNADSGADFGGAPDLDHHNPELRAALTDWLLWLREEFGFEGWRLDFAKGYAAQYSGEYISRSLPLDAANNEDARPFCVGELWCDLAWSGDGKPSENQDPARQQLCDWVDGVRSGGGDAAAFDFVTKGLLQAALASGELWRLKDAQDKPPGMGGWWPKRASLFVESHDTGSSQRHWPCPPQCLQSAYAYVLTHPGVPCLFSEHILDARVHAGPDVPEAEAEALRAAIQALLAARRECGLGADSALQIRAAEQGLYVADVAGSRATARVKLGDKMDMGDLLPGEADGWRLAASGQGFAVWAKVHEADGGAGKPTAR